MPPENCWLVSFDIQSLDSLYAITSLLRKRVGRCSMWNHRKELCKESLWMGVLKYIVMDGCMSLNESFTFSEKLQREKQTSSSVQWCQNSDLNCRKTGKSSRTKLATGACKNGIFFAVDSFPPCIPVTIFHSIGRLWLVNPRQLRLARAVRAPFSQHVMPFTSLASHMTWWGWQQVSLLIETEHFEVTTEMARQQ